jgi:methionine sulfoxide reductase heme-binding subunit
MSSLGWWWVRSWGLVAYLALWATVWFGVATSSRGAGGWLHTPTVAALHRAWSLGVVVATALHVAVVAVDPASHISALATVLPVGPAPVALGVIAAWWVAALLATNARAVPRPVWRAVHASAFGAYLVALVHGLRAGTDQGSPVVRAVVLGTAAALLGAVLHRIALGARPR